MGLKRTRKQKQHEAPSSGLERYSILREIGSGLSGKVYEARDSMTKNIVALKIFSSADQSLLPFFKNEFHVLTKLRHPNLIEVFDFGITPDLSPYFTMEYLHGETLSQNTFMKKSGEMNYELVYSIIYQIAHVLDYIHSQHVLHGDLKPSNIFLIPDEKKANEYIVKLMDFGLSHLRTETPVGLSGTLEYIAPEIIRGEKTDARSDLYSLGVILYELVTGVSPFRDETPRGVLSKHLTHLPIPIRELTRGIPGDLSACIHKLLEKDPAHRYYSAFELLEYIGALSGKEIARTDHRTVSVTLPGGTKVKREREKSKITETAARSMESAQVVLITGEHGIGKSHLLRELKTEFQLTEKKVLHVTCTSHDTSFEPVIIFLQQILQQAEIAKKYSSQLNILSSSFPQIFTQHHISKIPPLEKEAEKFRLFHAAASILTATEFLSAMFFFDDLHAADALTKEFIPYLVSYLEANRCPGYFLLLSSEHPHGEISESSWLTKMEIQAFTLQETTEYIQSIFRKAASTSFVQTIQRQTGGNPLFIDELLTFCADQKIIERTKYGWMIHEQDNLSRLFPKSLTETYLKKFHNLSPEEKDIITTLALSPLPIEFDLLAFVTAFDRERIVRASLQLYDSELIDMNRSRYRLKKEEFAPIIRDNIDAGKRSALHDRFIAYYDKGKQTSVINPFVLATHYLGSSQPDRAYPYLLSAGEEARHQFAYAASAGYLSKALTFSDKTSGSGDRFDVLMKLCSVYNVLAQRQQEADCIEESMIIAAQLNDNVKLASVYENQTEYYLALGEYDRAKKSAEKALTLFEKIGDAKGAAKSLAKIGWTYYRKRQGDELKQYYHRALQTFRDIDAPIEEGNALIDLGLAGFYIFGSSQEALQNFGKAREKFEQAQFKPGIARALGNSGLQMFDIGDYDAALRCYDDAQKIYTEIGDRRGSALAQNALGQALLAVGQFSDALRYLESGLKIAKEIRDLHAQERNLENLGELYLTLGVYDTSLNYYEQAKLIAEKINNSIGIISNEIEIAGVLTERKEFERAIKLLAHAKEQLAERTDINVACWLEYRSGMCFHSMGGNKNVATASEYFRALGDLADQHGLDSLRIIARSYLALCLAQQGNSEHALELSESALELLQTQKKVIGGEQDILLHHAKILRANKRTSEATAYIERAHEHLMERAKTITDSELYRSYLEHVRLNTEIIREFAALHRSDSIQALAAVRERNLKTLYDVSRTINSILDLPTLLDTIMDSALQTMNGERGMIFLIENDQLTLKVARNVETQTVSDATEISLSIMNDVIHGGKPIIVSDAQQDAEFKDRQSVKNFKIHSLICVPIQSKEKLIGTVYVDSRADAFQSVMFSEMDVEFLEAFANLAAIALDNARLHAHLKEENVYLRKEVEEKFAFEHIVGRCAPMMQLYQQIRGATASEGNVLIMGESGTGKELVARAIHYNGPRKAEHFVPVDCGALPDTLLESELFGYKKGAFTGAYTDKRGLFEEAHLGSLFLDEIGNTSLAFQAKLLRVLQEGEYRRVGDTESRFVNVRVVCATNKDLQVEMKEGRFRQDLFFRLNVIPITVPTLRERTSDIPLLVQHFIEQHNIKFKANVKGISKELIDYLSTLPWVGNVRELENLISRMLVYAPEDILSLKHLPPDFVEAQPRSGSPTDFSVSLRLPKRLSTLHEAEREHINYVLRHTNGNKTEAAKILNIKRTTLVERMKKLGMM